MEEGDGGGVGARSESKLRSAEVGGAVAISDADAPFHRKKGGFFFFFLS